MQQCYYYLNDVAMLTDQLGADIINSFKKIIETSMISVIRNDHSNQDELNELTFKYKTEELISKVKQLQAVNGAVYLLNSMMLY